jgi:uncharacterized membrane protein YciS (DUF1049 family)
MPVLGTLAILTRFPDFFSAPVSGLNSNDTKGKKSVNRVERKESPVHRRTRYCHNHRVLYEYLFNRSHNKTSYMFRILFQIGIFMEVIAYLLQNIVHINVNFKRDVCNNRNLPFVQQFVARTDTLLVVLSLRNFRILFHVI